MPSDPPPPRADAPHPAAIGPIAGVIVWTAAERFGTMRDFYRDTLGLPRRSERPDFISFRWPGDADTRLNVAIHRGVVGAAAERLRVTVNFAVDDIDAVHARLRAAGVPVVRPPQRESWGGRVCTFADPDGNLLQLFELPAGG